MTTTAWYIVPSKRVWARWFNVLHWPYTFWHLSYVAMGVGLAAEISWPLLGWSVLAFFLAVGVTAHCYDLLRGDPLRLGLPPRLLGIVGAVALAGAVVIGLLQVSPGNVSVWLLMAIAVGLLLVLGYNLEWPGLHGDWQFAAGWAVFPLLVGYLAQGIDHHPAVVAGAVSAFCSAYAQRVLSTRVRYLRRKVGKATVNLETLSEERHGQSSETTQLKSWLLEADEKALALMSAAMPVLALAILSSHL